MAKKTKDEKTIDIYNLKLEQPKQVQKKKKSNPSKLDSKTKDKTKNKPKTKNKQKKKQEPKDDKFDFDNEIVIGLTPVKENKKQKKDKKKNTKKKAVKKDKPKNKKSKKTKKNETNTKTFKVFKWVILIICLIASIIFFMLSPLFNIIDIKVEGNSKISQEQIISLSQIQIGQNTFKILEKNVKENVKQNAYIEDVELKRKLPNIVTIQVEERKPTFMLEFLNSYVYINNQGYILEISEEKLEVPIIMGYKTPTESIIAGNRLCVEDLEKLETVLKIVESANSIEILHIITKIDITDKQEYKLIIEEEQKEVYLGDASEIATKLLYVKQIIDREKGNPGKIFANGDMSKGRVYFREE